jgi:hypothetical protein
MSIDNCQGCDKRLDTDFVEYQEDGTLYCDACLDDMETEEEMASIYPDEDMWASRYFEMRSNAEMLAGALKLWTDKPPTNSNTNDLLAYFAAAHEAGVLALDVYSRSKGDQQ